MEKLHLRMLALMLLISITATSQSLSEGKQNYSPKEFFQNKKDFRSTRYHSDYFVNLNFTNSLTLEEQKQLETAGVQLIQATGNGQYLVALNKSLKENDLIELGVQSISRKESKDKLSQDILNYNIPSWAAKSGTQVKVGIVFNKSVSPYKIQTILEEYDAGIEANENFNGFIQLATLDMSQLSDLASHPLVINIDFLQEPETTLNFENRAITKVNTIQSPLAGQLNLMGDGVCIGIGDGGELGDHWDFEARVNNKADGTYSSFGSHGDHVAGIIGSSGNINPRHKGVAPMASLITQKTSLITYYLEDYYNQFGMVITNNSYGTSSNCGTNGTYNYTSIGLDNQLNTFEDVLHIFAAGNSGGGTCDGYPKGFKTVLRYYQAAKNVLTVGNLTEDRVINNNSSRGPVLDGRLKPEIVAVGTSVMSTGRDFNYYNSSGTSMAAPATAGIVGLMYEEYRLLNGGENPAGALMKAIACNTAEDLGNKGPDYTYGFGLINAKRAINVIENEQYYGGTLSNGSTASQIITVPDNIAELKVMLYWSDVEGVIGSDVALVNDLDLSVGSAAGITQPLTLDPTPARVEDQATEGTDRLNNIEQVVIDNPVAGLFTINVAAFNIPIGAQDFWVTYEFVEDQTKLTHPIGGETFNAESAILVQWESPRANTSEFKIEWSIDNGGSWEVIADDVAAEDRSYRWTLPAAYSEQALVRVITKSTGEGVTSIAPFNIIGSPGPLVVDPGCAHSLDLTWESIPEIEKYKVLMLTEDGYEEIDEVVENSLNVTGAFFPGEEYWFAIEGITATGKKSNRTIATKGRVISGIVCDWKNDGVAFLPVHEVARAHTSDSLSSSHPVKVKVFNAGSNELTQFELRYRINQSPVVAQMFNVVVASGDSTEVTFNQTADLSTPDDYFIETWMIIPEDTHTGNDYLPAVPYASQLRNDEISIPHDLDFTGMSGTYQGNYFGVDQLTNLDIETGEEGEVSWQKQGSRNVLSLKPNNIWQDEITFSKAKLTYNLSDYLRTTDPVVLSFDYRGHSFINAPGWGSNGNQLLVRGSDQDEWIVLHDFEYDSEWVSLPAIDITAALIDANQVFTSSFQIQFVQDALFGLYIDEISISNSSRLAVNWGGFEIKGNEDGQVDVNWSTNAEIDNNHFEVQVASGNAQDLDFRTIGFVPGQGNSYETNQYQYVDNTPNKTGIRYYRIKQVDFDGTTTYTEIRQLRFNESSSSVSVYPNPMMEDVFVHLELQEEEDITLQLVDLTGRVLLTQPMHLLAGNHDFPLEIKSDLAAGFYSLRIIKEGREPQAIRIQKIRD